MLSAHKHPSSYPRVVVPEKRGEAFRRRAEMLKMDLRCMQPVLRMVQLVARALPRMTFGWLRPRLYRLAGARIGERAAIYGVIEMEGQGRITKNLTVGVNCMFTTPLYLNLNAPITIGDDVVIGHHVMIITDDHEIGPPWRRCGDRVARPVVIEDGVWIAARATLLPGVTIGRGSVVGAGALVNRDVPPNTLVGGVPARVIRTLPDD